MFRKLQIQTKTPEQIERMRAAGLVVADVLERVSSAAVPGVSTADLDQLAGQIIRSLGAVPSFLGYHGYPATLCTSVNEQIVHAIPSPTQVLRDGDLISIDAGAVLAGWHGDAAVTVAVGEVSPAQARLMRAAEEALWAGIAAAAAAVRSGRGRLSDISHAIEESIRSAGHRDFQRRLRSGNNSSGGRPGGRYGIVEGYGGHGIGTEMHQDPHVLNYGRPGRGPRLVPGLCLAIEPMITLGSPRTVELADGWTVVTHDGSLAAHVEHTVALHEDGAWVLTARDGGAARLGELLSTAAA